jgi:diguanylate cyclase (GGDEF)-like protein
MALSPPPVTRSKGFLKVLSESVPVPERGLEVCRDLLAINELATRLNVAEDLDELRTCLANAFQGWLPDESAYLCYKSGTSFRRWTLSGAGPRDTHETCSIDAGYVGTVLKTGAPLWISDVAAAKRAVSTSSLLPQHGAASVIVLPCQAMGEVMAALQIESDRPNRFDKIDYHLACLVAAHLSSSLQNILNRQQLSAANDQLRQRDLRLTQLNQRLKELAHTDEATGLYNKRRLLEQLDAEIARCKRYGGTLSCLMLDLDYFKRVNDTLGHQAGDEVLRQVAALLRARLRASDFVARYGGEEFMTLLPNTPASGACSLAEHLRVAVADHAFAFPQTDVHLSVSIGIASYTRFDGLDAHQVILASDAALYRAKHGGRNRVCLESDEPDERVKKLAIH